MLLITVEPILFTYMMLIFMESNALQELVYVKSCIKLFSPENLTDCSYDFKANRTLAVNEAALWSKYNNVMLSLFTFITSFYVGSWSDRFGRKLPMLVPPIGTLIASAINATLSFYLQEAHVAYFLISSFISGVTFGSVGIIASTYGFIADFTHEHSRTKRIVILESMIFIGGTVGIYIAGAFLKHINYGYHLNNFVWLFVFEGSMAVLIVVYIMLRIPSRVPDVQTLQTPLSFLGLLDLRHVADSIKTIFRAREENKRSKIILMLVALFFIYFGSVVQLSLGYFYVKELGWNFSKYSNFHSGLFAVEGAALVLIFPVLYRYPHVPDHLVGILGLVSRIAGTAVYGLSYNDYMIYSCIALYIFSEFPVPALRSMLSKIVDADEKGRIFAFTTILQNLCYLLGSFTLMTIFTEVSFHGLCFEVVAALQAVALVIFVYLYFNRNSVVTVYESFENEDGTTTVICNMVAASEPIN